MKCYQEAFNKKDSTLIEKLRRVGKDGEITIPVKIMACASIEMDSLVYFEELGKNYVPKIN